MPTCLRIPCSRSQTTGQSWAVAETVRPAGTKTFTVWPSAGRVCRPLSGAQSRRWEDFGPLLLPAWLQLVSWLRDLRTRTHEDRTCLPCSPLVPRASHGDHRQKATDDQRERGRVDSASRGQNGPGEKSESELVQSGRQERTSPSWSAGGVSELSRNTDKSGEEAGREGAPAQGKHCT